MNKKLKTFCIRAYLSSGRASIGGWMQIPSPEIAEIMGNSDFDWVAVDLEHGSIGIDHLPNIFRALELNNTLPFARVTNELQAIRAMEAGAGGIIVANIESADDVEKIYSSINYPPRGKRGVGYNRANCYGVKFNNDLEDNPILVGMIESQHSVNNIDKILDCNKLDAVLIGPYDLSASFKMTGQFNSHFIKDVVKQVKDACIRKNTAVGIHVVQPDRKELEVRKEEGYTFIPYSIDGVILSKHYNITDNDESLI
jgi:2-dehydro-3-deoxyglucarate aldolase